MFLPVEAVIDAEITRCSNVMARPGRIDDEYFDALRSKVRMLDLLADAFLIPDEPPGC